MSDDLSDSRRSVYEYLRIQRRRFLDNASESEALRKAVFDMGLPSFEAESLLIGGAHAYDVALESLVDKVLEVLLKASADKRGRLAEADFRRLVAYARALANNGLSELEAEEKLKSIGAKFGIGPRGSGLFRTRSWYRRAGTQPAMATSGAMA